MPRTPRANDLRRSPHPGRAPLIRDPRDAAYRYLAVHAKRYPDLIPADLQTGTLDARDAALARAIVDAGLRRWRTLEYIIECVSQRRGHELEPRMRAVLIGGAAQLLLLDRVPPHAVLDESVDWAKRVIRPGAGAMVNAILRKVAAVRGDRSEERWDHHLDAIPLSEGGTLLLRGVELPEHGRRRLGIACSLPAALLTRWETMRPDPTDWALHTLCRPPTTLLTRYAGDLPSDETLVEHDSPAHRVFTGSRQELLSLLESHRDLWVQDPASSATLEGLVLERTPERIVDLCAGQGTKTRQLRAMFPESEIIACEVDPKRLVALRDLFSDDGRVRLEHASRVGERYAGWADLVLADVPCTNTGVLARRLEARYRPIDAQIKRLQATQRSIMAGACGLLKPGGSLLYATCSMEVEENEGNASWGAERLGMELVDAKRVDVTGLPGDEPRMYRDASFAAHLRKG